MGNRTMKVGQFVAQGDILLIASAKSHSMDGYTEVARDEHGRVVVARGETSGHAHVFRAPGVSMLAREGISDRVVTVGADFAALLHDEGAGTYVYTREHAPHDLPRGTYVARQQREWSGEEAFDAAD